MSGNNLTLLRPQHRRSRRALAVMLAAILVAACGIDSDNGSEPVFNALWTVGNPHVRIGSLDDPDYIFGPTLRLVSGPDGSLYSLHRTESAVRRWTAAGEPRDQIGRQGEGPGEFQAPSDMGFFGDSLWVWDRRAFRVSYFDLDGNFLGSASPSVDIGSAEETPPRPSRPLRNGNFVGVAPAWSDEIARGILKQVPYALMNTEGRSQTTIFRRSFEQHDIMAFLRDDGGGSFTRQPFGDDVTTVVGDRGILVLDRRTWTGTGEPVVRVMRIGFDGDTLFASVIPYEPVELASARFDSAVAASIEQSGDFFARSGITEPDIRAAMYRPTYLPAVSAMVEADDGSAWLRLFDGVMTENGTEMIEWWVLDEHGASVARVHTPPGFAVRAIAGDVVWGVETDELGVEYIVGHWVRR